ncbi:alpha/beta hydrolase [Devosia sp. XJ19-1]|uniref:Alpha/beta hydrolase n=1 Tax=Devosia ureilytica TaxID=2952754 RepID=A0A9Q4AMW2_9HYPH|nr:alpha/beta hydrolase [Devosia ureilytica]MCP8883129.1 alpha/beta hydrolase [Devosia ureilytica]MCP8886503.1 alpha/beta hydrolase [Devosia ureilytica]
MTKTIVLVHGAWLNSLSFEHVKARYEAQGYTVIVPNWPFDDRSPAQLRANPNPALAKSGQRDIIAHYEKIIRALPEQPILIGHSAGGVFVQHLLERGLGVAGVAVNPAPTPGVPLGPQAIISALPVLGDLFSRGKIKHMSPKFFRTRFAQTIPADLVDAEYERYVVPTAGRVYWDGIINPIKIDFAGQTRAPLLLIGGGKDLIADASMTKAIFSKQKKAKAVTALKIFEDRSHWTLGDAGWEEVADYALNWAVENAIGKVVDFKSVA